MFLFIATLYFYLFCYAPAEKTKLNQLSTEQLSGLTIEKEGTDSTTLIFDKKHKESDFFYYQDYYGEVSAPVDLNDKNTIFRFLFHKDVKLFIVNNDGTSSCTIHPGETIHIVSGKEYSIEKKGDRIRSNELNFITSLNKRVGTELEGFYAYKPSVNLKTTQLIEAASELYQKRIAYLEKYIRTNPVSSVFEREIRSEVYSIYYNDVTSLYANGVKPLDQQIENFIERERSKPVDTSQVDDRALNYTRYLAVRRYKAKPDLSAMFEIASKEFSGKTRDRVLYRIVWQAFKAKNDSLLRLTERFQSIVSDDYLKRYAQENFALTTISEATKDYSQSELVSPDGSILTWSDFLSSKKDTIVYVDFWASWCAPCTAEMPNSYKLRELFTGKKVSFVYISIDDINTSWKNSLNRVGLMPYKANNYRMRLGSKSKLKESLKISVIPRYMIIGTDGRVEIDKATRPSDPATASMLNRLLKE